MSLVLDRASRLRRAKATPAGGARFESYATTCGVFTYRNADGTITHELRHPDDVFDPASLESLEDVTVTIGHVAEGTRTVSNATWVGEAVGYVPKAGERHRDAEKQKDFVKATVVVQDEKTLLRVDSGDLCENSLAYHCDRVPEIGTYEGKQYNRRQREIRYKDLALLRKGEGRAGPDCALRLDAKDDWAIRVDAEETTQGEGTVIKILIDGVEYIKGSDEHLAKVNEMHKAEIAAARATGDALKLRTDAADKDRTELEILRKEKAERERGDALAKAKSALGKDFVAADFTADMTAAQIKRAVVSKAQGGKDIATESDEYVRAFFDLLEAKAPATAPTAPALAPTTTVTADARGIVRPPLAAPGNAPDLRTDGATDPLVAAIMRNDEMYYGKDFPFLPHR